jgi:YggT family protein
MTNNVGTIIQLIFRLVSMVVIVDVVISYFLPPHNGFRVALDQIVNPMLQPIKKVVPPLGNIDFSPIILLILLQAIEFIILRFI